MDGLNAMTQFGAKLTVRSLWVHGIYMEKVTPSQCPILNNPEPPKRVQSACRDSRRVISIIDSIGN